MGMLRQSHSDALDRMSHTSAGCFLPVHELRSVLHRHLWQRLPRSWRRAALFQATVMAAPRPTPGARSTQPFIIVGALSTASGLGETARLSHDALNVCGLSVFGIDLSAELMQPVDRFSFAFLDGRNVYGPATMIVHVNSPFIPFAIWRIGRHLMRNKYVVGYWAWELPGVPGEWCHGVPFVHEIWVPSEFTAEAVRPISAGRPVRVVPYPVARKSLPTFPAQPRDRPFTVLTIFNAASSVARKNPVAAAAAFRRAFGDDVTTRLIIKTANASSFPAGLVSLKDAADASNNIVLIGETMGASEIDRLYGESDVVMSLHRSEGFGLTLAEAMLHGLPVVATNWSGNVDFLNDENGIPVPYRLVPAEDPQGTYHHPSMMWADPDVDAAAEALLRLRRDAELARRLGEAGSAYAARVWSAQAYVETVRLHLGV
jgi:glycosyltransferase involved in cell wall biosynthesis